MSESMVENQTLIWALIESGVCDTPEGARYAVDAMEKRGWHFVDDLGKTIIDFFGGQDHVIAFSNNGWHIEHPVECRATGLHKCEYLAAAQEQFDGLWWAEYGGLVRGTKQTATITEGVIGLVYKDRLT
jgi:hypothetical protein